MGFTSKQEHNEAKVINRSPPTNPYWFFTLCLLSHLSWLRWTVVQWLFSWKTSGPSTGLFIFLLSVWGMITKLFSPHRRVIPQEITTHVDHKQNVYHSKTSAKMLARFCYGWLSIQRRPEGGQHHSAVCPGSSLQTSMAAEVGRMMRLPDMLFSLIKEQLNLRAVGTMWVRLCRADGHTVWEMPPLLTAELLHLLL